MTEYLYSLSLAAQTKTFLLALGFGFLMGMLYDAVRIARMCVSNSRAAYIASDLLYTLTLCFCSFLFLLSENEGEVRAYIIIGEAAGFAVWYFSLGAVIFSLSEKIIAFIKKIAGAVFYAISLPFRKIYSIFDKFLKKSRKKSKNIKNKSNFLLKVNKHMLYNLYNKKNSVNNELSEEREV